MSAKWAGLTPELCEVHWPEIESILSPAMEKNRSDFRPEDILLGAKEKRLQIWAVYDERIEAVVVTEILVYPTRRVCLVRYLAGKGLENWIHLLDDVLVRWAKAAGCSVMRGFNRKGLQPVLSKRGWRTTKVVMERDL